MMIFNVALLRPVPGESGLVAPGRGIDGGWAAFYAFLLQRKAKV
jgi:hypothetical protein